MYFGFADDCHEKKVIISHYKNPMNLSKIPASPAKTKEAEAPESHLTEVTQTKFCFKTAPHSQHSTSGDDVPTMVQYSVTYM